MDIYKKSEIFSYLSDTDTYTLRKSKLDLVDKVNKLAVYKNYK
jgi:hypothetical protein